MNDPTLATGGSGRDLLSKTASLSAASAWRFAVPAITIIWVSNNGTTRRKAPVGGATSLYRSKGVAPEFHLSLFVRDMAVVGSHAHHCSHIALMVWGKRRHRHQCSDQAEQCLLFRPFSAAQELAELDVR